MKKIEYPNFLILPRFILFFTIFLLHYNLSFLYFRKIGEEINQFCLFYNYYEKIKHDYVTDCVDAWQPSSKIKKKINEVVSIIL